MIRVYIDCLERFVPCTDCLSSFLFGFTLNNSETLNQLLDWYALFTVKAGIVQAVSWIISPCKNSEAPVCGLIVVLFIKSSLFSPVFFSLWFFALSVVLQRKVEDFSLQARTSLCLEESNFNLASKGENPFSSSPKTLTKSGRELAWKKTEEAIQHAAEQRHVLKILSMSVARIWLCRQTKKRTLPELQD